MSRTEDLLLRIVEAQETHLNIAFTKNGKVVHHPRPWEEAEERKRKKEYAKKLNQINAMDAFAARGWK